MEIKVKQPEPMMRVRCMRDVWWGPDKDTHKLYRKGEELVIPKSRFTDWHAPEQVTNDKTGRSIVVRGSFEDVTKYEAKPEGDAALAAKNERYQALYGENEKLREQLAAALAAQAQNDKAAVAQEKRTPGKLGKKAAEEI